jgi:hypothetical protein
MNDKQLSQLTGLIKFTAFSGPETAPKGLFHVFSFGLE